MEMDITMVKSIIVAAALSLGACGSVGESAAELRETAKAAVDEHKLVETAGSAVDTQALEALARAGVDGAVKNAIGEALPAEELAVARAIIDEQAIARGLDEAVNGHVLTSRFEEALGGEPEVPAEAR